MSKIILEIEDDQVRIMLDYLALKAEVSPQTYAYHILNEALRAHMEASDDDERKGRQ